MKITEKKINNSQQTKIISLISVWGIFKELIKVLLDNAKNRYEIYHKCITKHTPFTRKQGKRRGIFTHFSYFFPFSKNRKFISSFAFAIFCIFAFIAFLITSYLLNEIYFTLKLRIWLNENFVLLVDYVWDSDLVTAVSHRQAVDLKLYRLQSTMATLQTKRLRKRAWATDWVIIEKQGQAF